MKICLVTSTRSEYGILKPLISKLSNDTDVDFRLLVTGMHLSSEFGYTVDEIKKDNFTIDREIEILLSSDTDVAMTKSMGLALLACAEYFQERRPDMLVLLGDRFEIFAFAIAALNARIPIAHIHGGEITQGAIDDSIRHAITKLSYLHFASTEEYRKRIIQLGEQEDRVFYVGSLAVEQIVQEKLLPRDDFFKILRQKYGISLEADTPYAVILHHPVTLAEEEASVEIKTILLNLQAFREHPETKDYHYIFIAANADTGGRIINSILEDACNKNSQYHFVTSFASEDYRQLLRHSSFLLGNSSSGIIEAPSYGIPVFNIGTRQAGRVQASSTINIDLNQESLSDVMLRELITDPRIASFENPYYFEGTCDTIVEQIKKSLASKIHLAKEFYDLP